MNSPDNFDDKNNGRHGGDGIGGYDASSRSRDGGFGGGSRQNFDRGPSRPSYNDRPSYDRSGSGGGGNNDSFGDSRGGGGGRSMDKFGDAGQNLRAVDWQRETLTEIKKDFYKEHPKVLDFRKNR